MRPKVPVLDLESIYSCRLRTGLGIHRHKTVFSWQSGLGRLEVPNLAHRGGFVLSIHPYRWKLRDL